jgi:hypothetical protein
MRQVCPIRKRRPGQVTLNLSECRPYWLHTLPFYEGGRMIDVIEAIQYGKSTETKVPVGR